jgi:hypothetical protein
MNEMTMREEEGFDAGTTSEGKHSNKEAALSLNNFLSRKKCLSLIRTCLSLSLFIVKMLEYLSFMESTKSPSFFA